MDSVSGLGTEGVVELDAFEAVALDDAFASPRTVQIQDHLKRQLILDHKGFSV